jgi:hypothetical protein
MSPSEFCYALVLLFASAWSKRKLRAGRWDVKTPRGSRSRSCVSHRDCSAIGGDEGVSGVKREHGPRWSMKFAITVSG